MSINNITAGNINVGLLGCGAISQYAHMPALVKAANVEWVAVCDVAESLLMATKNQYNIEKAYLDFDTMLSDKDIDAVIVAVPDAFHVPLAIKALNAGKHVLLEKPLGESVDECLALCKSVRETGLKLQVGSMKRHDPGITFAHEFIQEQMGEILSVSGWYCDTLFRTEMQKALLQPLKTSDESITPDSNPKDDKLHYSLVTHGAHLFDNIYYLGGEVSSLITEVASKFDQYSWHGLLNFKSGAKGHFELTVKVNSDWSEGYKVHGEFGSVEIKTFLPFYNRPSEVRVFDARSQQWHTPLGAQSDSYKNQLESFARAILNNDAVNPDVENALKVVELLDAVEKSTQGHGWVKMEEFAQA